MTPERPTQESKEKKGAAPPADEAGRSGGINFQGPVTAPGAKIAGRDLYSSDVYGLSTKDLDNFFKPIMAAIQAAPGEQKPKAEETANELKAELAKGEKAEDSRVAKLVDSLLNLVPGAVSAVGALFGQPVLAGLAGPVTQFVLSQFGL